MSDLLHDLMFELHNPDPVRRDQLIRELIDSPDSVVRNQLLVLLENGDSSNKCDAAEALCRIDSAKYIDRVAVLLQDQDQDVRWFVCGLMYDWGESRHEYQLLELLKSDPDPDVRLIAATCLGRIGDSAALPVLSSTRDFDIGVGSQGHSIRFAAVKAIDAIRARLA